jgi:hypothetical protein
MYVEMPLTLTSLVNDSQPEHLESLFCYSLFFVGFTLAMMPWIRSSLTFGLFPVYEVSCCLSLVTHNRAHHYLILRTNSRKSPPSTHFSSPPPPTPSPPPEPPPLTPQPSPTSPITLAGRPPTTEPDAMTMFAGITVFGRILTFSLTMANWLMVTFSPMCTCDDIEMAWIVQPGPKSVSTCRSNTHCTGQEILHTNIHIVSNLHGIVVHLTPADSARWLDDAAG